MNTFYILISIWVLIGLITFVYLFFESAPYGRHIKEGWGVEISARLGWIVMESPCVILMLIYGFIVRDQLQTVHTIFLLIWLTHYVHRTFIYPFLISMTNPKMPISIAISAFFFNIFNGLFNGYYVGYIMNTQSTLEPNVIVGIIIFLIGMFINISSDNKLISLRKDSVGYKIPHGGFFKYVSCPNYFGEIIEWFGYLIIAFSLPALSFVLWTGFNLIPRALNHHEWYKENFKNYPKNRKAVIPFII